MVLIHSQSSQLSKATNTQLGSLRSTHLYPKSLILKMPGMCSMNFFQRQKAFSPFCFPFRLALGSNKHYSAGISLYKQTGCRKTGLPKNCNVSHKCGALCEMASRGRSFAFGIKRPKHQAGKEYKSFVWHNIDVTAIAWHPSEKDYFVSGDLNGIICHWFAGSLLFIDNRSSDRTDTKSIYLRNWALFCLGYFMEGVRKFLAKFLKKFLVGS